MKRQPSLAGQLHQSHHYVHMASKPRGHAMQSSLALSIFQLPNKACTCSLVSSTLQLGSSVAGTISFRLVRGTDRSAQPRQEADWHLLRVSLFEGGPMHNKIATGSITYLQIVRFRSVEVLEN